MEKKNVEGVMFLFPYIITRHSHFDGNNIQLHKISTIGNIFYFFFTKNLHKLKKMCLQSWNMIVLSLNCS